MTWEQAPLIRTYPGDPCFWRIPAHLGPHRILVTVPCEHPMVRNNTVRSDMQFLLELADALSEAGLVRLYMKKLYARGSKTWAPLTNEAAVAKWLQGRVLFVTTPNPNPPYEWEIWKRNGCENAHDFVRAGAGGDDVRSVLRSPPEGLCRLMCQSGDWEDVIEAAGILQHPYHKDPRYPDPEWMPAHPVVTLRQGPEDYAHLHALFSGFNLPDHSHCAVYTFLFGAFHVASLTEQRPVLVIDSWERGRGKTELSSAIKYLIDKKEGVKSSRRNRDATTDESIASLRTDRVEVLDNIDKAVDFIHSVAVTATTAVLQARGKFEAESTQFSGKMFLMNCVVGAASFHRDLLARILRVEIPGQSQRLDVIPIQYARAHRNKIIYEIMHAHEHAEPRHFSAGRMAAFMETGLSAYCHVFNVEHQEAIDRLQRALNSGKTYSKRVLGSLMREHPEKLDEPYYPAGGISEELLRTSNFDIKLTVADLGASAFGMAVVQEGTDFVWR